MKLLCKSLISAIAIILILLTPAGCAVTSRALPPDYTGYWGPALVVSAIVVVVVVALLIAAVALLARIERNTRK